jgi:hypothetical protein
LDQLEPEDLDAKDSEKIFYDFLVNAYAEFIEGEDKPSSEPLFQLFGNNLVTAA